MPKGLDIETMEHRKRELSKALKVYIEQIVADSGSNVKDKSVFHRFFGFPLFGLDLSVGHSHFFKGTERL